jgi:hypothetical protein
MSVRNKEYHDASGQSQNEAMACIWAADKIDNSHLWSRVTNIRQRWQAAIEGSPRDPQSIAAPSDKIVGGRSWGCVSAIDSNGRTIWIADAHRDDGKRFVVHADEKLTAFLELEAAVDPFSASSFL